MPNTSLVTPTQDPVDPSARAMQCPDVGHEYYYGCDMHVHAGAAGAAERFLIPETKDFGVRHTAAQAVAATRPPAPKSVPGQAGWLKKGHWYVRFRDRLQRMHPG